MSVGLCLTAMQVVAVLGLMSARWPDSFATTSSGFQILILDLDGIGFSCPGWEQGGNQLFGNHSHYSMHLAVAGILPCSVHMWLLGKDRAQTLEACIHSEHNGTRPSDRIWLNCSSCIETHDVLQAPNWWCQCLELP